MWVLQNKLRYVTKISLKVSSPFLIPPIFLYCLFFFFFLERNGSRKGRDLRAIRDRKRQEKLKFPSTRLVLSWRNETNVEEVRGKEAMKLIACFLRQGPPYTFLSPIPHTLYRAFAFRPQSNGFVNFQVRGKKTGPEEVELFLGPIPHVPGSLQRSRLCRCLYFGVQSENKTHLYSYPSALISTPLALLWLSPLLWPFALDFFASTSVTWGPCLSFWHLLPIGRWFRHHSGYQSLAKLQAFTCLGGVEKCSGSVKDPLSCQPCVTEENRLGSMKPLPTSVPNWKDIFHRK